MVGGFFTRNGYEADLIADKLPNLELQTFYNEFAYNDDYD
jgi:hypothetical protein